MKSNYNICDEHVHFHGSLTLHLFLSHPCHARFTTQNSSNVFMHTHPKVFKNQCKPLFTFCNIFIYGSFDLGEAPLEIIASTNPCNNNNITSALKCMLRSASQKHFISQKSEPCQLEHANGDKAVDMGLI